MKNPNLFWMIVIMVLQGFFACKSDDISPQTPPQISSERIRNLIENNEWQQVEKPKDATEIIFLKDVQNAIQFFQNLIIEEVPQTPKFNHTNNDIVLTHGVFTFLNGDKVNINFENSIDGRREISEINLDKDKLTFTQKSKYVEMQKWGIIALPTEDETSIQPSEYQYFFVPVAVYKAFLENGGWSSVQFLNAPEQANFEGEGGIWEEFYVNLTPFAQPKALPKIPGLLPKKLKNR